MGEAPTGNPATDFALALLTELTRRGVHDIVLSPGSRSQALAIVAAEFERAGVLRLHVRIDERVAGFLALGLGVESGRPAVVITTSGTATANLHPAVLEAHHGRVPMILLTADRPAELHGIRANQTTRQAHLYGPAVRWFEDVAAGEGGAVDVDASSLADRAFAAALGSGSVPGPVHLNIAFREPLSVPVPELPQVRVDEEASRRSGVTDAVGSASADGPTVAGGLESAGDPDGVGEASEVLELEPGAGTVVIAGHGAGPAAEEIARAGGWPLLAEVSSGARYGRNLVVAYRELLREPGYGDSVRRAVVFGHPTLSREVPALVSRPDVETITVSPAGADHYEPARRARRVDAVRVAGSDDSEDARAWLGRWVAASRRLVDASAADHAPDIAASRSRDVTDRREFLRAELAVAREPVTRRMLVDALWRVTWPHDRLVFGASRLVRDADRAVVGKRIRVHANRGLAGIDGTVATALGIALASQDDDIAESPSGITRVLLGDHAFLHDTGALLFGRAERRPRIQVIVGNDGGGSIFDGLEVAFSASEAVIDRVFYAPQDPDVTGLAAAYGWQYARATTHGELERALTAPIEGPSILEVPLPR